MVTWPLDLATLPDRIWNALAHAVDHPTSPFRTAVLGSQGHNGCLLRTIVLRRVSQHTRSLVFYSDVRTEKIRHIWSHPAVQWLFYDPSAKLQIRAEGQATVHHQDQLAAAEWDKTPPGHKTHYRSELPPGTIITETEKMATETPVQPVAADAGFDHFAAVQTIVEAFDWYDAARMRRARCHWNGTQFQCAWLVP